MGLFSLNCKMLCFEILCKSFCVLSPLFPLALNNEMVEYFTSLSIMILSIVFTSSIFKTISRSKTANGIIRKTAQVLSGQLVPNIVKVATIIVDKCTIVMHIANVTFQFSLPILDMITFIFLQSSKYVSNHYAAHRKRKRKRYQRELCVFLAMSSTHKMASPVRNSPVMCQFDTDTFLIGLDSYSSRCVSNQRRHFVNLKPTN